jgi:hypothetical protein
MRRANSAGIMGFTTTLLLLLLSGTAVAQSDVSNLPLRVTDLNGDGVVDCAGACEGDVYTIGDFKDALALLYGGLHHNGVKNCNSDARRALVAQWGTLFNCQNDCPNGLQHAWRGPDLSQDTLNFLSMVGLSRMAPPQRPGSRPAVIDLCNAYSDPPTPRYGGDADFLDNDPVRIPCDPHEDVCGPDGTMGVVLPIVPPSNLSSDDRYPSSECTEGAFEKAYEASRLCPDGRPPTLGLCSLPVLQPDSGGTDFRCTNSASNCPTEAPLNADCRSYNLVARTENGAVEKDSGGRDLRGAFFRIHSLKSATGETCNATTARDQISCLNAVAPDTVGFATPPSPIIPKTAPPDYFTEDETAKIIGFISDVYGAAQAGVTVIQILQDPGKFFKNLFGPSELDQIANKIIAAIKAEQRQRIEGAYNAAMGAYGDALSTMAQKCKEGQSLDDCVKARKPRDGDLDTAKTEGRKVTGEIQGIIRGGDVGQAYMLAKIYNLVTAAVVGALKLSEPQDRVDKAIQTALQYNFDMVGADEVLSCTEPPAPIFDASVGKLLWKKFKFPSTTCLDNPDQPHPNLSAGVEVCDVNNPAQCWLQPVDPALPPQPQPPFVPTCRPDEPGCFSGNTKGGPFELCYNRAVSKAVSVFNQDDTVDLIKRAISAANANGFGTVLVPRGKAIDIELSMFERAIFNASFRHNPPSSNPQRLPQPVCAQDVDVACFAPDCPDVYPFGS